jgi:hypothetical protein
MLRRVQTKQRVLIDAAPTNPSVRGWHEPFSRSVEALSDEALAAQFGGWVLGQVRDEPPLADDSSRAAEGVHQTTRLLLNLANTIAEEGDRPNFDVQGALTTEYLGRLIGQIAEVMGPDFVQVHLDG